MDISTLPKVELHCHIDGILDPEIAQELQRDNQSFPVSPEELEQAYSITNIDSFFKWWDYIRPTMGSQTYFYPIFTRHIERLKTQRVVYTEIMIGAGELPSDPPETVDKLCAFREWVNTQESGEIQIEFLIALGRQRPPEDVEELAEFILALHKASLIAGIALAGPEIGYPVQPFHPTLAKLHEAGIKIEIHAGEWAGPESIWDALEFGFPDRIGHGTSLFQDARLVDYILDRQIHIEFCLTSNLKTGSISCIEGHPVRNAKDLGINFGINTDDPGPLQCSMESEYRLLANIFKFDDSDFHNIMSNSLSARFQSKLCISNISSS